MSGGFSNKPQILHGAFVEYGLGYPQMIVPFQFNPVQLTRSKGLVFSVPNAPAQGGVEREAEGTRKSRITASSTTLREFHQRREFVDLLELRRQQEVRVQEERISFEIRLDATDALNEASSRAARLGIIPQLSSLELMLYPKGERLLGVELRELLGSSGKFSFTRSKNPPMILFVWGRQRILPVNINNMNITETEFSTDLNPIRATIAVNLTVIEGPNPVFIYTNNAMKEAMSGLNLSNPTKATDVVIPG